MKPSSILLILILFFGALFGGCDQNGVVDPLQHSVTAEGINKTGGVSTIGNLLVSLISLPSGEGKNIPVSTTQTVTRSGGGKLQLSYTYKSFLGINVSRTATFTVAPYAVKKNVDVTMSFDTTCLGVRFKPEGLVFSKPALLDFSANGLNILNVLYNLYWDDENGNYVQMKTDGISINVLTGSLTCSKAQIPHFSRYGFGR